MDFKDTDELEVKALRDRNRWPTEVASDPPSPLQEATPMPPLKTVRFAFKTARIAGKVIKLGLRIRRARRGRGR